MRSFGLRPAEALEAEASPMITEFGVATYLPRANPKDPLRARGVRRGLAFAELRVETLSVPRLSGEAIALHYETIKKGRADTLLGEPLRFFGCGRLVEIEACREQAAWTQNTDELRTHRLEVRDVVERVEGEHQVDRVCRERNPCLGRGDVDHPVLEQFRELVYVARGEHVDPDPDGRRGCPCEAALRPASEVGDDLSFQIDVAGEFKQDGLVEG